MDENGEFILSPDCLLEIMNYVITDCKSKAKNVKNDSSSFGDLIHFVLAHEFFLELLEVHYKRLYDDLEMAIACKIIKLLIEQRINKISSGRECCWSSYLQSVRENSPFNLELSFGYLKEKRNHSNEKSNISIKKISSDLAITEALTLNGYPELYCEYLEEKRNHSNEESNISIKKISSDLAITEALTLNGNITTEVLSDICISNPNLRKLTFEGSTINGTFSIIAPHCENLEELRIRVSQGGCAAPYAPLVLLPNLKTFVISGIQESGSQSLFFDELRKWHRPKSMLPLTVTIEDCLKDISKPITLATFDSLRYLHISTQPNYPAYYDNRNVLIKINYDLSEILRESEKVEDSLATITLAHDIKISFDWITGKLELKIHPESDISQMGSLSKLPNLIRLVIHNKCRHTDFPNTIAKFLRSMAPKGSFALKSSKITYGSINQLEASELAKIESIRFLGCHLSDWNSIKFFSQLPNLQHLLLNVREKTNSNTLKLIVKLLTVCQVQASIIGEDFRISLKKNEKKMEIYIDSTFVGDLTPLAQLTGVNTLRIDVYKSTGPLNPLFEAFATSNLSTIEELRLSVFGKNCFKDIFKVAEIQTIKELACYIEDLTGIEILAELNNLRMLTFSGKGSLDALFAKLAERNIIQCIQSYNKLIPEELTKISQIRSLKKLACDFSNLEDLKSLSELASSSIEELYCFSRTEPLNNLIAAFSLNSNPRLNNLQIVNLDISGKTEISKIKGLKILSGGFLNSECASIDKFPHLEFLKIENRYFDKENIFKKSANALALKSLLNLQILDIKYEIGFDECKYLVELEKLKSLACSLANDPGINVLANIQNLQKLTIYKTVDSLCGLYRAFALKNVSILQELHAPIKSSDEIREISQIKSLITLNIEYMGESNNLADLAQLNELKSLRIAQRDSTFTIDSDSLLLIIKFCQKLDIATFKYRLGARVKSNFVHEVYSILKSIRNPALQKPLNIVLDVYSFFPRFHVEPIDEAYLNVSYPYRTYFGADDTYQVDFFTDNEESDQSDFDYP